MEILDQLALALGFATLAGINLYLVAFVTGLAVHMNWLSLADKYHELAVLGEPPVLIVAGTLMVTELFADKIPWVDSIWDSFHTLIRPVGGGLLAISALGTTQPEYDVIIALIAGSATMVSHSFKTGSRIVVNNSPEPVSNTIVSVAEDVAVLGGLTLMAIDPKITAGLSVVFLLVAIYALPKLFRRIRGFYWLLFNNVVGDRRSRLPLDISADEHLALAEQVSDPDIEWSVPVLTGRAKGLPEVRSWLLGQLVSVRGEEGSRLFFVGNKWRKTFCFELPSDSPLKVTHECGLVSEQIVIFDKKGTFQAKFRVPRSKGVLLDRISSALGLVASSETASPKALPAAT